MHQVKEYQKTDQEVIFHVMIRPEDETILTMTIPSLPEDELKPILQEIMKEFENITFEKAYEYQTK